MRLLSYCQSERIFQTQIIESQLGQSVIIQALSSNRNVFFL